MLERQGRLERSRWVWKKGKNGAAGQKVKLRLRESNRSMKPKLGHMARTQWMEKSIVDGQSQLHFAKV